MSNRGAKYLHTAILVSVGESVSLNVGQGRSPGQNSRVQLHILRLQVRRTINICGLMAGCVAEQEHHVFYDRLGSVHSGHTEEKNHVFNSNNYYYSPQGNNS